jgi:8-oxo-dGTP pyrophosphatase MutT (NUDIX family)
MHDFFQTRVFKNWEERIISAGNSILSVEVLGVSVALDSKKIFAALIQAKLKALDGLVYERTVTLRGDAVVVIPICSFDPVEFVVVRQFRPGSGKFSFEFPAGALDSGEVPVEAAIRELQEETGLRVCSDSIKKLSNEPLVVCESAFDESAYWYYVIVDRNEVEQNLKNVYGISQENERIRINIKSLEDLESINSFHVKTALQLLQTRGLIEKVKQRGRC